MFCTAALDGIVANNHLLLLSQNIVRRTNLHILLRIICRSKQIGPLLPLCVLYPLYYVNTQLLLPFQGFRCRVIFYPSFLKSTLLLGSWGWAQVLFFMYQNILNKEQKATVQYSSLDVCSRCAELSLLQCNTAPCWWIQVLIISQGWGCLCVSNPDRMMMMMMMSAITSPSRSGFCQAYEHAVWCSLWGPVDHLSCSPSALIAKMGSHPWKKQR